jgi:trk system potassium uptake protein TrkA
MLFEKPRNVIVAGASRLGAMIAGILCDRGYHVTIVDIEADAFRKLPESFAGFEVVADATDVDALGRVGLSEASMLIATTESDDKNSLIAQIGRRIFGVPRVFLRLDDPEKENMITGLNIEVLSPTRLSMAEFKRLSDLGVAGAL